MVRLPAEIVRTNIDDRRAAAESLRDRVLQCGGMKGTSVLTIIFGTVLAAAASYSTVLAQQDRTTNDGVYGAEQAKRGAMLYAETCAACHDPQLIGGVGPALTGNEFMTSWKDQTVGDLFERIKTQMPLTAPGTLTPPQVADAVAYILSFNKYPAGMADLPTDDGVLKAIKFAAPGAGATGGGATAAPATAGGGAAGLFADAQAKRGESVYADQCATCHDAKLIGGVGPALAGKEFITGWKAMTVADLFDKIKTQMPLTAPGTLSPQQTADLVAFILSSNHFPAGSAELPSDSAALKKPLGEPPQ
jgi:mono/diheme cytochrome c family protein